VEVESVSWVMALEIQYSPYLKRNLIRAAAFVRIWTNSQNFIGITQNLLSKY
jgi:hypothetical protein